MSIRPTPQVKESPDAGKPQITSTQEFKGMKRKMGEKKREKIEQDKLKGIISLCRKESRDVEAKHTKSTPLKQPFGAFD